MKKGLYKVFRTRQELEEYIDIFKFWERQNTLDAVCLALSEKYKFGEKRFEEFREVFQDNYNMIVELQNADLKDDKNCTYSKEYVDRLLKQALGERLFVPWEKRYSPEGRYN